ncbi:hypothetical protein E0H73_39975 [Kribbella pittospori]|uniref:Uncharacterized protein n=1 Tax=Kribbella pittospori TaxID=722689 RepID=A0A4R0JYC7_9ACTN|nr:hypothetical protein [Kribbella pittospori]TCC52119.1 hypothetical protein E0H73_39975 [Kribbella pittospori]
MRRRVEGQIGWFRRKRLTPVPEVVSGQEMASLGGGTEWILDFSPSAVKAIGTLEILAVAGLDPVRRARHRAGFW